MRKCLGLVLGLVICTIAQTEEPPMGEGKMLPPPKETETTLLAVWEGKLAQPVLIPDQTIYVVNLSPGKIDYRANGTAYIEWKGNASDADYLGESGPYEATAPEVILCSLMLGQDFPASRITSVTGAWQDAEGVGFKVDSQNRPRYVSFTVLQLNAP